MNLDLTQSQLLVIGKPVSSHIFLEGPFGMGKTSTAVARLLDFLQQGIPAESILLITPQPILASPYLNSLNQIPNYKGGQISSLTIGGLAKRMIRLFWPMIAEKAGFKHPDSLPTYLNLENVQYYIARLVRPLLDQGYFSSISIDRNRLFSQIIDNLNKAAVVGFPHTEIADRLKAAWSGEPGQLRVYEDAQYSAALFRQYCLDNNFLDFSLQIETFRKFIWPEEQARKYLFSTYQHLFVDNVEEDNPVTHDLLLEWLPECASATLVFDQDAGYRKFLGASPETGVLLRELCEEQIMFNQSLVMSPEVQSLQRIMGGIIQRKRVLTHDEQTSDSVLQFELNRFFPSMLDWVSRKVNYLVDGLQIPPGEICILSPFLSDALRFSVLNRLQDMGIPARSHRPSRALRDEPATLCTITLALLAHPQWTTINPQLAPNPSDIAYALIQAIDGLDLIRAQLLVSTLIKGQGSLKTPTMASFDQLLPEMQERISFQLGEKYENIRLWIEEYQKSDPIELDFFISRLFGEVLSQPGFGFHRNYRAAEIISNLVDSIQNFRRVADNSFESMSKPMGLEYIETVREGIIAAQYLRSWEIWSANEVLIAPAYTYLMYNRAVDYQFWLDIGSRSWAERLYQPVTQPYILSRSWDRDRLWTEYDEVETSEASLFKLVTGLLRRCRRGIYLGLSDLGEQGYEQRGPLLASIQKTLQVLYAR